jgi:hypothetical protein
VYDVWQKRRRRYQHRNDRSPQNPGYPTYWHARNYGLFALNPLGQKVFSEGKETLNFKLAKGEKTTFKYRVVIASGKEKLSSASIDQLVSGFTK